MEAAVNEVAEAWRGRVASQQASGQSIRAWCRQNNHREHAFYWWRVRLGLSPAGPKTRPAAPARPRHRPVRFQEVVVDRAAVEPMRLRLGGGRELILPASMPFERLAQLIHAIEATHGEVAK